MKLVIEDASSLKSAIDSVVNLVEEGLFEIKQDGLHLKAMDPSQISMISFKMPKTAFVEYNLEEETKIGLDITQLSNILSRGKKGEKVELSLEDGRLVIKFIADKRKRTFKTPLLDVGESLQREPKIEFGNYAVVSGDALKEVLKDAKLVSSHVKLMLTANSFIVEVRGDNGEVKAEFEKGQEVSEIKSNTSARATFPLQYLEDIVKASSSSSAIKINLETDRPLKVEYSIHGAEVAYYLAPRIESE
ncbi:MAG: proliferating cell nuclear antigen (pcna) [Candidatus Micrarchaeota archaeon]